MDIQTAYRAAWTKCHGFRPHHELSPEDVAVMETMIEMLERPKPTPQWVRELMYWLAGLVFVLVWAYVMSGGRV